jgi:hypothetical protein
MTDFETLIAALNDADKHMRRIAAYALAKLRRHHLLR